MGRMGKAVDCQSSLSLLSPAAAPPLLLSADADAPSGTWLGPAGPPWLSCPSRSCSWRSSRCIQGRVGVVNTSVGMPVGCWQRDRDLPVHLVLWQGSPSPPYLCFDPSRTLCPTLLCRKSSFLLQAEGVQSDDIIIRQVAGSSCKNTLNDRTTLGRLHNAGATAGSTFAVQGHALTSARCRSACNRLSLRSWSTAAAKRAESAASRTALAAVLPPAGVGTVGDVGHMIRAYMH